MKKSLSACDIKDIEFQMTRGCRSFRLRIFLALCHTAIFDETPKIKEHESTICKFLLYYQVYRCNIVCTIRCSIFQLFERSIKVSGLTSELVVYTGHGVSA